MTEGKRAYLFRVLLEVVPRTNLGQEEIMEAEELAESMGILPPWKAAPKEGV